MTTKLFFLLFYFAFSFQPFAQNSLLDRKISIEIKSTSVKTILTAIEKRANVQFSYNPMLVNEHRIVSLSIKNQTIAFGLSLLFEDDVRFKEVGNHIVLLLNENNNEKKQRKRANLNIVFKGQVIDKRSQLPLYNASIYDVDSRYATLTDAKGFYRLKIPKEEAVRSIYVKKKGFKEFVFVVDVRNDSVVIADVALEPLPEIIEKIENKEIDRIYQAVEDEVLSGSLISYETVIHNENLKPIKATRIAQISLVPSVGIGSDLSTNGLITNKFSLNLLAGYSNGVDGAEIGGLFNVIKGSGRWFQFGGIYNLVGENFHGLQVGGIGNTVRNKFIGGQVSGIGSYTGNDFYGLQVTGISSTVNRSFKGVQISGIMAAVKENLFGLQVSGIHSAIREKLVGLQVGGIATSVFEQSIGLQVGGIINRATEGIIGGQISGIANQSNGGTNILQVTGILNLSDFNIGLQTSGIFNYSRINNGLQVGLINVSKNGKGIALGLLNFVWSGYHKTEVEINELFPFNLTLKSGVCHFYNNYTVSARFLNEKLIFAAGLGFGSAFDLTERVGMNLDLTGQIAIDNQPTQLAIAHLYKFSPTIDFKLANWIRIFAGPSLNANITFTNGEPTYLSALSVQPRYTETNPTNIIQVWVGGKLGLRL